MFHFSKRAHSDTVYLVRTFTGITLEYPFSTMSKLFPTEKDGIFGKPLRNTPKTSVTEASPFGIGGTEGDGEGRSATNFLQLVGRWLIAAEKNKIYTKHSSYTNQIFACRRSPAVLHKSIIRVQALACQGRKKR